MISMTIFKEKEFRRGSFGDADSPDFSLKKIVQSDWKAT